MIFFVLGLSFHILLAMRRGEGPAVGFDGTVRCVDDIAGMHSAKGLRFTNRDTKGEPF